MAEPRRLWSVAQSQGGRPVGPGGYQTNHEPVMAKSLIAGERRSTVGCNTEYSQLAEGSDPCSLLCSGVQYWASQYKRDISLLE